MRIAEVIGRVTLSRANPQLRGGRLLARAAHAAGRAGRKPRPIEVKSSSSTTFWAPVPAA